MAAEIQEEFNAQEISAESTSAYTSTTVPLSPATVSVQQFTKVDLIKTFVGGGVGNHNGKGTNAKFNCPWGLCFNPHDDCLYISDHQNNTIKKVTLGGQVNTFVNFLHRPTGIVINYQEKCFYASGEQCIIKISASGSTIIFAGATYIFGSADGVGAAARFYNPTELAIDQKSGTLFVCDEGNHLIRKISPRGKVTTLAGKHMGFSDGQGEKAYFHTPNGICFDEQDQSVIVSDNGNNKLRRIKLNGEVSTMCDIPKPGSIVITDDQSLLVISASTQLCRVYRSGDTYKVELLVGSGKQKESATDCAFECLRGIAIHPSALACFVADYGNHSVQKIFF